MAKRFSLKFKTEVVEIEDKDGTVKNYTITELAGPVLSRYMNSVQEKTKIAPDGTVTLSSYDGMYTDMLKLALLDENNICVSEEVLNAWPASVQKQLFEIAQGLNSLDVGATEEAKNS